MIETNFRSVRNEYDRSVNTFSSQGRLFQVEYALESVKFGSTAVGIETSEGIVLAAEKRIYSKLQIPSSMEKIMKVMILLDVVRR